MMRAFYKIKNNTYLTANCTKIEKEGEERRERGGGGQTMGLGSIPVSFPELLLYWPASPPVANEETRKKR
jgi:hypothetical protein